MYVADFVEVIGGTVIGALATAVATYLVSLRVERVRDRTELRRALAIVLAEVGENRAKLEAFERGQQDVDTIASWLTYGDWAANKGAVAGLGSIDLALWADLVQSYRAVYSSHYRREELPKAAELADVEGRLRAAFEGMRRRRYR